MGVFIGSIPNNTEEDVKLAKDILNGTVRTKMPEKSRKKVSRYIS